MGATLDDAECALWESLLHPVYCFLGNHCILHWSKASYKRIEKGGKSVCISLSSERARGSVVDVDCCPLASFPCSIHDLVYLCSPKDMDRKSDILVAESE